MKKRIPKKGIVYCLKSKEKQDWIYLYKIWCTQWNIKNRRYYWNSKIKIKFNFYDSITSNDIFKTENDFLWKIHWLHCCINKKHFELIWWFDGVEEQINILFSYKN